MTAQELIRATHGDSDGTGYCRGCGTTVGEPHHTDCIRLSEIGSDPNHLLRGQAIAQVINWPTKHVRLRLEFGNHGKTLDVRAVSDTMEIGWYAMENAIAEAYEGLPSRDVPADPDDPALGTVRMAFVELTDADGNRRIVEDTDLRGEEWLKDLVAGIEIVNGKGD